MLPTFMLIPIDICQQSKEMLSFLSPALEGVANRALMASALHYYNLFKINIMNKTALKSEGRNYNLKKINNFTETQKNNTKNAKSSEQK